MLHISAPGKVIISGEHAVVYGQPALVAAVNRRLTLTVNPNASLPSEVTLEPEYLSRTGAPALLKLLLDAGIVRAVETNIPVGSGMGSSAALAVTLSALLLKRSGESIKNDAVSSLAYELEKFTHGTPSGVDNTITTYGGLLRFQKTPNGPVFANLIVKKTPVFLLINTGQPDETTSEMVTLVREKLAVDQDLTAVLGEIGSLTKTIESLFLSNRDLPTLQSAIQQNERYLEQLGVVSQSTQQLIRAIESFGGAAKISGAGGRKSNSGVLLAFHENPSTLQQFLAAKKIAAEPGTISTDGIEIEEV